VLTTGCDKTTPAMLMGAATVDIPAIVLSGGPMLNGYYNGGLAGSGTVVWFARQELAAGRIDYEKFLKMVASSAPSVGHCNTMGTALSMNSVAEALGMSLPGCAAIPGPYRERPDGLRDRRRIVDMVHEDLRPSKIMTRKAFENAIVAASALGASTNCPPHVNAIARHMGVDLRSRTGTTIGYDIPLLVNLMPAGQYLGEEFHRAGGVPAVMNELLWPASCMPMRSMTVSGKTIGENLSRHRHRPTAT
jgi:dihydroxy-acid dehydratase